jgi:hypothetical protein
MGLIGEDRVAELDAEAGLEHLREGMGLSMGGARIHRPLGRIPEMHLVARIAAGV